MYFSQQTTENPPEILITDYYSSCFHSHCLGPIGHSLESISWTEWGVFLAVRTCAHQSHSFQTIGLTGALQILPMFLTLLPLVNMVSAFSQFGIKPTKQVEREQLVKVSVIYDRELDNLNGH